MASEDNLSYPTIIPLYMSFVLCVRSFLILLDFLTESKFYKVGDHY